MPDKSKEILTCNSDYQVRKEILDGKSFLVVPAVMMVEGVHHGSSGPVFHTAEELAKFPSAWNGRPVVIYHPEAEGVGISASSDPVLESIHVGKIYNAVYEETKLKAELWLDENKLQDVSEAAYTYIMNRKPLEVSIGVFSDEEKVEGVWGGESYIAVSHNYRPDHLALLPGSKGACGWEDGCGIRTNQKKGDDDVTKEMLDQLKQMAGAGVQVYLLDNVDAGYSEKMSALREQLNALDTDEKDFYLVEAYDDYFIYDVFSRTADGKSTLYKRQYKIDADGNVEFTSDPEPVKRNVTYDPVTTMKGKATKGGMKTMADKNEKCCPEKVELIMQNGLFKEDEREFVETLDERVIDTLLAMSAKTTKMEKDIETLKTNAQNPPKPADAIKVLKDHFSDPDAFLGMLPPAMAEQMRQGMQLYDAQKQSLIDAVMAASPDVFTEEELKTKPMSELQKLGALAKAPVDYSGFGTHGRQTPADEEEAMI